MKKYELVKEDIKKCWWNGTTLYRVRYLIDLPGIKAGDLGGYIASEKNLSLITDNATVIGDAIITDNATVANNATVEGNTTVANNAIIAGNARVADDAIVTDNATITDDAVVVGNARVSGNARVADNAKVADDTIVAGDATIGGNAVVTGNTVVTGNASIFGNAKVSGNARIRGGAIVADNARVAGNAVVTGNARLYGDSVCVKFDPINIIGLSYNVTITDNNVHIGCKTFKLEQALKLASRWKATKLKYEEAKEIEAEKKIIVEAIKYRLWQLSQLSKEGESKL